MKKEEIDGVVDCLIIKHPDIFLNFVNKYYSTLPKGFLVFKNFIDGWPFDIIKPHIDYDSYLPEEIKPKKIKLKKTEIVSYNEAVFNFLKSNVHFINWKEFSRKGVIVWNERTITEFKDKIYWGLNSEQLENDFKKSFRSHRFFQRLFEGGVSFSPYIDISSDLIKEFNEKWDFKALSYNHALNWDVDSFIALKKYYLEKEAIKSFKKIENTFASRLPIAIEVRSKEEWMEFKKQRDFIDPNNEIPNTNLFTHSKNIFQKMRKASGKKAIEFVNEIGSFSYEKYRIACLYGFIYAKKYGQKECLFVIPSFEPLYDVIKPWFIYKNDDEVLQVLKRLDHKKVQTVKTSISSSLNSLRSDLARFSGSDSWESYSKSYCPACQEDPCMCSDRENSSTIHEF